MQKNQRLTLLVQIAVSMTIAIILFTQIDFRQFTMTFGAISWPTLGVMILLLVPSVMLRACRWKLLFDDNTHRIGLGGSTALLLVGMALNLVLPASGGDIVKSYFGYKWSGVKERMLSVSLLDKVIALASIAVLGIPCALFSGKLVYAGLSLLVLLPAFLTLGLPVLAEHAFFLKKLFEWATKIMRNKFDFSKAVEQINPGGGKLAAALALSVAGWLLTYFQMYLCFRAVGVQIPLLYVFSVAPLLTLVRLFPFTLSGVGSDEAAMWYFFSRAGAELEGILAGAFVFRLVILILPGITGLFILGGTRRMSSMKKQS